MPVAALASPQEQEISHNMSLESFRHRQVVDSQLDECTILYGMPVMCAATGRRATIGGVVLSNSKYYGFTVGHAFTDQYNTNPAKDSPEAEGNDPDFVIDDEDEEEIGETDLSDIAITSQGSRP